MVITEQTDIKRILVISLSNIGDAILTFPVVDALINAYPNAEVSVIVASKSKALFLYNPKLKNIFEYDKKINILDKLKWVLRLRREKFDLVIDLKNSAIPFILWPRYRTSVEIKKDENIHMKDKHIERLKTVYQGEIAFSPQHMLFLGEEDEARVNWLLKSFIKGNERFVVMAPGSLNEFKRWDKEKFKEVARHVINHNKLKVVFIGDGSDKVIADFICDGLKESTLNLCGKTSLLQCAGIVKQATMALVNDSGPMHMASYFDKPVVALFGPSKVHQYGPWSSQSIYLKGDKPFYNDDLKKDQKSFTDINSITVEQVIGAFTIKGKKVILNHE